MQGTLWEFFWECGKNDVYEQFWAIPILGNRFPEQNESLNYEDNLKR